MTTIAHELGHCFGLDHNGYGDRNFDGMDGAIDLMLGNAAPVVPMDWIKPSNQARVRHFFRDLTEDEAGALPPANEAGRHRGD